MKDRNYDVAAYIWPAYCQNDRTDIFWPEGDGEWQSVRSAMAKYPGDSWPRRPLWGYVDEADPRVMEMQIDEATCHGVNVFIYDWYWYDRRPYLENCLNDGFLGSTNRDKMRFYLMWANHDAVTVWDKRLSDKGETVIWQGAQDRTEFERIARRLTEKYFLQDNYYRIDGCPVFCIYDLDNLIRGLGGVEQTRAALDWWRAEAVRAGLPGLHLQCILRNARTYNVTGVAGDNIGVQREVVEALGFDSVTHYQYVHIMEIGDYDRMVDDMAAEREHICSEYGIPYFPHVSIGWDNNPRFRLLRQDITTGNTPQAFARALREARDYLDAHPQLPPLVTVNSWNEWTETSYLEPDDRNGYGYLEAVRRVFVEEAEKADRVVIGGGAAVAR